jgi:hypothetical protein
MTEENELSDLDQLEITLARATGADLGLLREVCRVLISQCRLLQGQIDEFFGGENEQSHN